jgi:pseudouridine-5'-phosphate glycosidase
VLVTVPVPAEAAIDANELESILDEAVRSAADNKITGKEITPFLLAELGRKTSGQTLKTNIALLENNARVAAEIALAMS